MDAKKKTAPAHERRNGLQLLRNHSGSRNFIEGLCLGEHLGDVGVHGDAGAERGGNGGLLDVAALRSGRFEAKHLFQCCCVVLGKLDGVEGNLADDEVQVGVLVDAEVDLSTLDVVDGLGDVGGHGARLRVRHQVTRTQDLTEAANLAHEVRGGNGGVEVGPAGGDLFDQVVGTNEVGAGCDCCLGLVARGEDQDAGRLTGAVGQVDGAADHLVSLAGVNAEAEGHLNRGVELGRVGVLGQRYCLERCVVLLRVDLGGCCLICFAALCHAAYFSLCSCGLRTALGPATVGDPVRYPARMANISIFLVPVSRRCRPSSSIPSTVMPMERAVPAMIFAAPSRLVALRSSILVEAISLTWAWVSLATLTVCGVDEPLATPAAFLMSSAAGGVLVMNVKERSS